MDDTFRPDAHPNALTKLLKKKSKFRPCPLCTDGRKMDFPGRNTFRPDVCPNATPPSTKVHKGKWKLRQCPLCIGSHLFPSHEPCSVGHEAHRLALEKEALEKKEKKEDP